MVIKDFILQQVGRQTQERGIEVVNARTCLRNKKGPPRGLRAGQRLKELPMEELRCQQG
jgi:hypothetical protein